MIEFDLIVSEHAQQRMAQRSLRSSDLDLAILYGTEVEGGYLLLERDLSAAADEPVHLQLRLRRLVGRRVVIAQGTLVTVYVASERERHRLTRPRRRARDGRKRIRRRPRDR